VRSDELIHKIEMGVSTRNMRQRGMNGNGAVHSSASVRMSDAKPVARSLEEKAGHSSLLLQVVKLLGCIGGIYGAYITQGLFQEILSTKKFDGERFPHLATLNSFQSWACFMWAFGLITISKVWSRIGSKNVGGSEVHPPILAYWKAGFTNCFGPALGFQALYYIPYPAQVLAKSSKMIPVMILGTLMHNKRYSVVEYACCLMVTMGVSLFAGSSSSKSTKMVAFPNAPLGYFLCLSNLVLDGYTNVSQDEINRKYKGSSALNMMCWMNFWTGVFYLPMMFVVSRAGVEVVGFCMKHPAAAYDILSFCLCGAVGQLFIFYTIRTFGSLSNTLITTTRKFFSILASVVWSGNALVWQQWMAVFLVFTGLIASSITKHRQYKHFIHHTKEKKKW